ncbi:MAG: hypothetical protein JSW38_05230 [Dehalococcoidia bacterium]|nr:MAG: hypothetical protein JSW38_05230 [Dehalococcoidia bacterium]
MRNITIADQLPFIALRLLTIVLICSITLLALADRSIASAQTSGTEYFNSVDQSTSDSDSDGYDDTLTLRMDVDTTGGYVDVSVDGYLSDLSEFLIASDFTFWRIYGEDIEYGILTLTVTSGQPGEYFYYLELYDAQDNWEDSWIGSAYLYPTGYGVASGYQENFYSVTPNAYDSDYDGYNDSVTLQMDVNTTGGYVTVTTNLFLDDSQGYQVYSDSLTWTVYGQETEYGEFYVTITSGDPDYFSYYLELYDDQRNLEDSWSGSVSLFPLGFGATTLPTATRTPFPTGFPTPSATATPGGIPPPDDGGLNGGVVAGIVMAALTVVMAGIFYGSRAMRGRRTADARIRELRAQMERWRQEGFDVSELEDLFK